MHQLRRSLLATKSRPLPLTKGLWRDYLALTKPRVISLLLFSALLSAVAAAEGWPGFTVFFAVLIGGYAATGAANTINMVWERDLDLRMERTQNRPVAAHRISTANALTFAASLLTLAMLVLGLLTNWLAAAMALAGAVTYVVIYTFWLKRRTWLNIVIGGAAGAFPPLVGWAAATGGLPPVAWSLFILIFLWTPVHFWSLALLLADDYAKAGVPMLPVVRGPSETARQVFIYSLATLLAALVPFWLGETGALYLATALVLSVYLVWLSWKLHQDITQNKARSLFHYSMIYLALIFLFLAIDRSFI